MATNEGRPSTYEEAIAQGFAAIEDIDAFIAEKVGISPQVFWQDGAEAKNQGKVQDCATSPPGSPCFDFCYSNGVRVIGYCGNDRQCSRFVHGACDPY